MATRKSPLALWQSEYVKNLLIRAHPHLQIHFLEVTTTGDVKTHIALSAIGGKNLFVKELQSALLTREADIAVHSIKDLSCTPHASLVLSAICEREDPRDVFVSPRYKTLAELPLHAVVGTSSPRRECQLKRLRPDLQCKLLRGNVETRINKLLNHEYDAIILAAAGLIRLGLQNHISDVFSPADMLPAIGQAAIGIECRRDDHELQKMLAPLHHLPTALCVTAERAVNFHLGGDCFTPIAAHATLEHQQITVSARVGSLKTHEMVSTVQQGPHHQAAELGYRAAQHLLSQGAKKLLQP